MGFDTAANAVYGVQVPEEWTFRLQQMLLDTAESLHKKDNPDSWKDFEPMSWAEYLREDEERFMRTLRRNQKGEVEALVAWLGAPPDAQLFWTGDEDDRPGRCETEANSWLVGYGLLSFPRDVPKAKWKPEWHTWVEGF